VHHVGPSIPIHEADEEDDPRWPDDGNPPRRRRAGGWIVALVMLVAVGFFSFAVERRYQFVEVLAARLPRKAAGPDPRLETFVAQGADAFLRGDLDTAQGSFDKASVLDEKEPRVLLGEARVAAAKADISWLKLRILPADAMEDIRATKSLLDEQAAVARRTADEALTAAPQDPHALRAKLDSLRLAGDIDAARAYVVAIFAHVSEPETAYVLAALDLAQAAQPTQTLDADVDRLRVAAAAETRPGRAQAALVYALVKVGDTSGATGELAKMDASTRAYPLLPNLHAWVGAGGKAVRLPASAEPVASVASAPSAVPSAAASAMPSVAPAPVAAAPAGEAQSAPTGESGALQIAMDAMRRGDFDRAERVYQGLLASNPNDSQALAGLGDVLRMRHDPQGAIDAYKRALGVNPSYVPAVLGLGDTQWAQGDHAAAARTYKGMVDHFPEGTYPAYVSQRAAGGQ
jgi:tetratricopeptide (TPR) repeat protein